MASCLGYEVLRRQDNPPKLLLWDIDEAGIFLVPVVLGMMIRSFVPGLLLAIVARKFI